ncbi:hypothetical protein TIFTF001_021425 [Ficus carica]|uniref:Transcription factor UPBEAT1 n=1 Tax=Ficus carica TaxID=3494 RepID=A0AA88AHG3_FICCA|nr:hypothetical protein TIFTF001_021425 [Ficus carica]
MGVSQHSLLEVPLELKGTSGFDDESSFWKKRRIVVSMRSSGGDAMIRSKRPKSKRVLMKRRRLGASRRRGNYGIVRRVRTLKRLIPNSQTVGSLDGLFRETADYILSLQMRVRVMQILVKVLSGSE